MKQKLFALFLALALVLSLSVQVFAYTVPSDTVVYVTNTGSCYHRWGCASLKSVAASYTVAYAEDLGYYGCSHCHASRLTGTHTPTASNSSSGSSSHSSSHYNSSIHSPPVANDYKSPSKSSKIIKTAVVFLVIGFPLYIFPLSMGRDIIKGIKLRISKKKPLTIENNKPNALPISTSPARRSSPLLSAPMPVPQILGQPAALYTILSPDLLQSSDYSSALQSFSSWAQTCGFSVHRAFSFSDVCFPDVPLKQRTEFMALLSLCKQADRPFDVLLVQHPYCLSLNPQTLEKIRRGFDDLGVKLFFRYLPPISYAE